LKNHKKLPQKVYFLLDFFDFIYIIIFKVMIWVSSGGLVSSHHFSLFEHLGMSHLLVLPRTARLSLPTMTCGYARH